MITTEKEAGKKWCPFARVAHSGKSSGETIVSNRIIPKDDESDIAGSLCIGSRCMAWIWNEFSDNDGTRRGFCGLALPRWGVD